MLIAIDFPEGFRDHESMAKELVKDVKGKTIIYMPKTIEDFVAQVKKYEPKKTQHLVLLRSHLSLLKNASEAEWRSTDLFFQARGGAVWGEDPERENLTYVDKYSFTDTNRVVVEATYNAQQASGYRALSKKYLGRTYLSPNVVIFGFNPTVPSQSRYSEFFMSGLPADWWRGVGFLDKKFTPSIDSLMLSISESKIVSVGEESHQSLLDNNVEHGAVPGLKEVFNLKGPMVAKKYGMLIRDTTRTGDDNRAWRP